MKKIILLSYFLTVSLFAFSQQTNQQKLSDYIERAAKLERFSGAVIVQQGEETLLKKCHGVANIKDDIPITLETSFDIGSISKQFTATAILKLCDQNKIKLNESINTYLEELASKRWKNVTVHHLLSHQSGIPSVLQSGQGLDDYWPKSDPISWEEQLDYFKDLKLIDKPGEEYRYNNTGYILLALIIEKVSGKPFDQYMLEDVFQPNELTGSSVGYRSTSPYAKNHYHYPKQLMELAPKYHSSWYRGAGGVYSTVTDLSKWVNILYNGHFLSEESKSMMFSKQAKNYGYGWVIGVKNDLKIIHHDGTNFGSTGFVLFVPDQDIRIVILTNQTYKELYQLGKSEGWVKQIAYDLMAILLNEEVKLLPELSIHASSKELNRFVGEYKFVNSGESLKILKNGNSLMLQADEMEHSVFRHYIHQELPNDTSSILSKIKQACDALSRRKFWKFGKYCDGEMKFVSYSGLLSMGYKSIVKDLGEIQKTVVYEQGKNYAISRFFGESGNVDFILYFNDENKISGLFDIGYSEALNLKSAQLTHLINNRLLLDGFAIGETDAEFELIEENGVTFLKMTQHGRIFRAKKNN